jgi:hypothetical protein
MYIPVRLWLSRKGFCFVTVIRKHSGIAFPITSALIMAFEIYSYKQNVWNYSVNQFMNVVPCGCSLLSWWGLHHTAFEVVPFFVLYFCQQPHNRWKLPVLNISWELLKCFSVRTFAFLAAVNLCSFSFLETWMRSGKRRLNSGNACYHSVQNLLSSRLLSKNIKIRIY